MGFVEETGVAQHYRDIRIAPIYEGTNGIQALDLVGRKLPQGRWRGVLDEIRAATGVDRPSLVGAADAVEQATEWLLANQADAARGATPYLRMFGILLGGHLLAVQADAASARLGVGGDDGFLRAKIATADFFVTQIVPHVHGLLPSVMQGAASLFAVDEAQLAA